MTFVVIAKQINKMLPIIEKMDDIYLIKINQAKAYFYYNGKEPLYKVMKNVVNNVTSTLGDMYMINVFEIYKEVTDIGSHLTEDMKKIHPYYDEAKKELTNEEVEEFKKQHNFI